MATTSSEDMKEFLAELRTHQPYASNDRVVRHEFIFTLWQRLRNAENRMREMEKTIEEMMAKARLFDRGVG